MLEMKEKPRLRGCGFCFFRAPKRGPHLLVPQTPVFDDLDRIVGGAREWLLTIFAAATIAQLVARVALDGLPEAEEDRTEP